MRSIDAADYQAVPRPIAVMPKTFAEGASTGRHSHARGQILYATDGLMIAQTDNGAWTVPTSHALLIPPRLPHEITMHGNVRMLTAYVSPEAWDRVAQPDCRVIRVSRLMDATLDALGQEPVVYDLHGRGGHLAEIILDEVFRAETVALTLPLPADRRLRTLCEALLADPGLDRGLDDWAGVAAVSRRTLTRAFRRDTGLSFGQWLRRLRQLHVLKLQAEGQPAKLIAAEVGYSSPQACRAMVKRAQRPA